MYLCVGTFLTTLKICKATTTKQKKLGETVFNSINPKSDYKYDESGISAVFRGRRNLHSYLQLEFDEIDPKVLSLNFAKDVIPLLDENKRTHVVRLLQALIKEDCIDSETHVELVNRIKKKDLLCMNEIVFEEFLAGIFLYVLRFTDNLNREEEVKAYKSFAEKEIKKQPKELIFVSQYLQNSIFEDNVVRPVSILYKAGGTIMDVVFADILEVASKEVCSRKTHIVIPVNTTFDTILEDIIGNDVVPLVSANTIHGQWIVFMQNRGITTTFIDEQIERSLFRNRISKCGVRNTVFGKQDLYPIGSVASVIIDDVKYYLLALSEFDKDNKAKSDIASIKKAINTVIDYYDIDGQGYDIYIPLVGSGRSRAGLSLQESYDVITEILMERKHDIFGRVHIVIHPNQAEQVDLRVQ